METFMVAQGIKWQGFVLVIVGSLFHSLYNVINKKSVDSKAPSGVIAVVQFLLAGALLLVFSALFDPPKIWNWFDFSTGLFWPLLSTCLLNIIILLGNIKAMKYVDLSISQPIAGFQPFFSILPSYLILGELPNGSGYLAFIFIAIGLYWFSFKEEIKDASFLPQWTKTLDGKLRLVAPLVSLFLNKGVQISFLVAVCGAVAVNFDKKAAILSSPTFAAGIIVLFVGIYSLLRLSKKDILETKKRHLPMLVVNGVVFFFVLVLYWIAFRYGIAIYIGALKRTGIIFTLIFSSLILKEQGLKKRLAPILIFTVGLFLLTL